MMLLANLRAVQARNLPEKARDTELRWIEETVPTAGGKRRRDRKRHRPQPPGITRSRGRLRTLDVG